MNSDESSLLHLMPLHKNAEIRGVGGGVILYRERSSGGAEFENRDDQSIIPVANRISINSHY